METDDVSQAYDALKHLRREVEDLRGDQVLVFGDVMLDRHVYGIVDSVTSDAPIPVMRELRRVLTAGATAHTAAGLLSLGLRPRLFGVVGEDTSAEKVRRLLLEADISTRDLAVVPNRPTTIKTRFIAERPNLIAQPQQLLRVDREVETPVDAEDLGDWLSAAVQAVRSCRVMVVSDYGKGAVNEATLAPIMAAARKAKVPVVFDPKLTGLSLADGAEIVLFATRGLELLQRRNGLADRRSTAQYLLEQHEWSSLLELGGPQGVRLHRLGEQAIRFPSRVEQPRSLLGMHDAAAVGVTAALCRGLSHEQAAELANCACELAMRAESSEQAVLDRDSLANWIDEVAWQLRISQR